MQFDLLLICSSCCWKKKILVRQGQSEPFVHDAVECTCVCVCVFVCSVDKDSLDCDANQKARGGGDKKRKEKGFFDLVET